MSSPYNHTGALLDTLTRIETVLANGRHHHADSAARLSLQRLWICAGEAVHRYCAGFDIGDGIEPWSEVRKLRDYLAHHLPDEIDDGRLWAETTTWINDHLAGLRNMR